LPSSLPTTIWPSPAAVVQTPHLVHHVTRKNLDLAQVLLNHRILLYSLPSAMSLLPAAMVANSLGSISQAVHAGAWSGVTE